MIPERVYLAGECPACAGRGTNPAIVCGGGKSSVVPMPCGDCRGTGTIDEARAGELNEARAMYLDRVGRGVTLSEEAARLGISPVELSRKEHAR